MAAAHLGAMDAATGGCALVDCGASHGLAAREAAVNLLLYGVVALAILGTLGGIGYKIRQSGVDACTVERKADEQAQAKREQEASAKAAADLAAERAKRKVITRERTVYVDRNIEKLADSGRCFTPDGVRNINCAINGKDAAGCKPDG